MKAGILFPTVYTRGHSILRVVLLCLLSLGQLWGMGVLLLTRQTEALLLFLTAAGACWLWWGWASHMRKQRAQCALAVLNLLLTFVAGLLCLWDMLKIPPLLEKIL